MWAEKALVSIHVRAFAILLFSPLFSRASANLTKATTSSISTGDTIG
jgi:hypothetical protein